MIAGERCDIHLMPAWERRLRNGDSLDYENQLMLFNSLVVLQRLHRERLDQLRDQDTRLGLMNVHFNELAQLVRVFEMSGLLDPQRVTSVVYDIAATFEDYNDGRK